MTSKGKPSPRSAVKPLSDEQVAKLAQRHHLVNPTKEYPTGPRIPNEAEINAQNPKATARLLKGVSVVLSQRSKVYAWGLEHVPETGPFITAATHVTMYDVFVPMMSLFHMGRRPRFMAKAEMAHWPVIGKWFQTVGMQPVPRRSGQAKAIETESINILTSGRPLTIWPEGTLTRDPQKWPMSMKSGVGYIALEASRRLGYQIPLYCSVTWGAASINQWWPWPRKNVVMCYDDRLDYADLLATQDSWGDEPPAELAQALADRVRARMEEIMAEIRGEQPPAAGYWDYRTMSRKPRPDISFHREDGEQPYITTIPPAGTRA
ncbi:lysophospholipid acyltransferase family protein [Bifidobacterium boum]|uniref:Acyltransferase n=1 Tax=Bifidobacterium boum TaxID=78343 RepID=A0A086ZLF7_9BIFI|nr:lysophospholipid acyltransferase family protein [Bifidobacterium boum]KFI47357.1 acyltransferase [Bifidobacterium boum]KFJ06954.1 PlsC 1-acyl-sn-glycerol-3-phosphate acyltransferase [Bifidobacterium thermophilum]MCF2561287.1 1-acyl-sn-glycerol-3-phosphate acyltransferase [Bifidobacterium boum]MCI5862198.1 1-acyl-sn-glycerol-3-phosphate acyltransferase [Bifidobacterium boum]